MRAEPQGVRARVSNRRRIKFWDQRVSRCAMCQTNRFHRSYRNCCVRCYKLLLKIHRLKRGTYRSCGRRLSSEWTKHLIKWTEDELRLLAELERGVIDEVQPWQIEGLLVPIIQACRANVTWLPSVHSTLRDCFDEISRKQLYLILLDIVENLRCRGLRRLDPDWRNARSRRFG